MSTLSGDLTLAQAMDACAFRSVITLTGQLAPILGAIAIIEGPALPLDAQTYADARDAFDRGGTFLIMASRREDRDAAKAALMAYFAPAQGAA